MLPKLSAHPTLTSFPVIHKVGYVVNFDNANKLSNSVVQNQMPTVFYTDTLVTMPIISDKWIETLKSPINCELNPLSSSVQNLLMATNKIEVKVNLH